MMIDPQPPRDAHAEICARFTNEAIRAVAALRHQHQVCREQDGKTVIVSGMDAAREYIVETVADILAEAREAAEARAVAAEQERDRLREALGQAQKALTQVEWIGGGGFSMMRSCAWCRGWEIDPPMDVDYYGRAGHKPNCPRQRALSVLPSEGAGTSETWGICETCGADVAHGEPFLRDRVRGTLIHQTCFDAKR